jgi:hypothetical protein
VIFFEKVNKFFSSFIPENEWFVYSQCDVYRDSLKETHRLYNHGTLVGLSFTHDHHEQIRVIIYCFKGIH